MKTHLPVLLRRALLLAMAAVCTNTLSHAEESTPEPSKTPATLPEDGIWDGEDVNYSWNSVTTSRAQGEILKINEETLTIKDSTVSFSFNTVNLSGARVASSGAVVLSTSLLTFNDNPSVVFDGNCVNYENSKGILQGGALYVGNHTVISNNIEVSFSENSITAASDCTKASQGAAIYAADNFECSQNTKVEINENYVDWSYRTSSTLMLPGAIYANCHQIAFNDNKELLSITGNHASGNVGMLYGGAIYAALEQDSSSPDIAPSFRISGNKGKVAIIGNYGETTYDSVTGDIGSVYGGAIYVKSENTYSGMLSVFEITGNEEVVIKDNAALADKSAVGGAIYANDVNIWIQGNDYVLIEGNYEKEEIRTQIKVPLDDGKVKYETVLKEQRDRLRSIYFVSGVEPTKLDNAATGFILSANDGGIIEMRDGVTVHICSAIKFNADYEGKTQTGDIILTGAYTEANLNAAIAAHTADGKTPELATETEIANSQQFVFQHYNARTNTNPTPFPFDKLKKGLAATLEGGRLIVEEGAHYVGMGFEAVEGSNSTLRLKDAQFDHSYNRTGSNVCTFYYDVTMAVSTTLEAEGVNTMTASNLTMKDGSAMSYVVGSENTSEAVLSFVGGDKTTEVTGQNDKGKDVWGVVDATSSLTQEGAMTIWVKESENLVLGQRYALLSISDNVTLNWDADNLTVKGVAKASDLAWDGKTLYLTYNRGALDVATWVNEEGNNKWDGESYNWTEDGYLYSDTEVASKVLFDDTAEGGEVELVGTHTPEHVEVNNSANNDYSFIGEGSLDGDMKLVKNGEGSLLIDTENSYDGGTEVNGGELAVGNDKALGAGKVSLKDNGTLNLGSQAVTNDIEAAGGVLRGADQYLGNLVVSEDLTIEGNATAKSITMLNNAGIVLQSAALYSFRTTPAAVVLSTDAMYVRTEGDGNFTGSLTLNEGGLIELNNGNSLVVTGTLTLGEGTTLMLNGNYAAGDMLVSAAESLTLGSVILDYDDTTVELERIGNSLVLVSKFKQDKADIAVQGNWGIATASRAFVNTVRGQHSNTGCIANGRGTVWAAAFGAFNDLDGSDINVKGAAVGVDAKVGSCSTVGIALGYTDGEVQPAGMRDVDQEGTYIALYGEHGLKKLSSTSCLSLDWVAAYGNTESDWNGTEWEQDSLQLNTRLNWNKKLTDRLCMSVFGGLEYFATDSDTVNGVKTGSIQNLRGELGVGARYVAWGAPGVYDGKGGLVSPGCEKLVLHGEVRYMNDMVRSNPVVRMNGLSGSSANPGRQGIGIEAGATYRISDRWSASANYGYNAMEDSREHRVNVGASYTF